MLHLGGGIKKQAMYKWFLLTKKAEAEAEAETVYILILSKQHVKFLTTNAEVAYKNLLYQDGISETCVLNGEKFVCRLRLRLGARKKKVYRLNERTLYVPTFYTHDFYEGFIAGKSTLDILFLLHNTGHRQ